MILFISFWTLNRNGNAASPEPSLTDSQITDLCISALTGHPLDLNKLIREYHLYLSKIHNDQPLSRSEKENFNEIEETIELLAPYVLHKLSSQTVTVEPPQKNPLASPALPEQVEPFLLKNNQVKFFVFSAGNLRIFSGQHKDLLHHQWVSDQKTMKLYILSAQKLGKHKTMFRTLMEVLTHQDAWLAEQTFMDFVVSLEGIEVRQKTVFSEPSPQKMLLTGHQESYQLAKFPLKEGTVSDNFRIESLHYDTRISSQNIPNCLLIRGLSQQWIFEPQTGLIMMDNFEDRWTFKEDIPTSHVLNVPVPNQDRKLILKEIKNYCKKKGLVLDQVLEVQPIAENSSLSSNHSVREENYGLYAEQKIYSRTLAYEKDREDSSQKRYQVLEQKWVTNTDHGQKSWELLP